MKLNSSYVLGVRAIKSVAAVFICFIFGAFFGWEGALTSSIAAIICIQPTIRQTRYEGIHRVIGTIMGGFLGYGALKLLLISPEAESWIVVLAAGGGTLVLMYLCNFFNVKSAAVLACITYMNIIVSFGHADLEAFRYVVYQTTDTIFGIITALLLNWIFPPPPEACAEAAAPVKSKRKKKRKKGGKRS